MKNDEGNFVRISLLLVTCKETENQSLKKLEPLPLEIWRYVNGSPLLDFADDALSCVMATATREISWEKFGHHLKYLSTTDSASDSIGRKVRDQNLCSTIPSDNDTPIATSASTIINSSTRTSSTAVNHSSVSTFRAGNALFSGDSLVSSALGMSEDLALGITSHDSDENDYMDIRSGEIDQEYERELKSAQDESSDYADLTHSKRNIKQPGLFKTLTASLIPLREEFLPLERTRLHPTKLVLLIDYNSGDVPYGKTICSLFSIFLDRSIILLLLLLLLLFVL